MRLSFIIQVDVKLYLAAILISICLIISRLKIFSHVQYYLCFLSCEIPFYLICIFQNQFGHNFCRLFLDVLSPNPLFPVCIANLILALSFDFHLLRGVKRKLLISLWLNSWAFSCGLCFLCLIQNIFPTLRSYFLMSFCKCFLVLPSTRYKVRGSYHIQTNL